MTRDHASLLRDPTTAATRRLVLVVVLLGLLAVAVIGAAMVGGLLPDPLRAGVPAAVPSTSASPRFVYASPTSATADSAQAETAQAETALALEPEPFHSSIYGYAIRPPLGWDVAPATEAWNGLAPWTATMADGFNRESWYRRLTVVAADLPPGLSGDAWIEAHSAALPVEFERSGGHSHCVFHSAGGVMTTEGASVSTSAGLIDWRPARIRTICGHITGSVVVDDRVFQFSLFIDRLPNGDRALFDAIMATVDFDPPTVQTEFVSDRYGYSLTMPDGWSHQAPPVSTWTDARPWLEGETDRFRFGGSTFEVAAHAVPAGMAPETFLAAHLAELTGPQLRQSCGYNGGPRFGPYISGASPRWVEIPYRAPTWARGGCNRLDAVVFDDDVALVMSLFGAGMHLPALERLFEAIEFGPTVQDEHVSDRYGYRMSVPSGWRLDAPATSTWAGPGPWVAGETDRFRSGDSLFEVAGHSVPTGMDPYDFLDAFVSPQTPDLITRSCNADSGPVTGPYMGSSPAWHGPATPIVSPMRIRRACDRIDAVVFEADNSYAYVMTLWNAELRMSTFDRLYGALLLEPPPASSREFVSEQYGYRVEVPDSWTATPASKRWTSDDLTEASADVFRSAAPAGDGTPDRLLVAARSVPQGTDLVTWGESHVPWPEAYQPGFCKVPHRTVPFARPSWESTIIGGVEGFQRSVCGQTDGLVLIGEKLFWLSLAQGDWFFGAHTGQAQFQALADSIVFDEGASVRRVRSELYGYTIDIPRDWTATRAKQRWTGFGTWEAGAPDRFTGRGVRGPATIDIVGRTLSEELLSGRPLATWLADVVPLPPGVDGTRCRFPGQTLALGGGMEWTEGSLGGRDALVRSGCGAVQAAIKRDGAVWIMSMSTDEIRADADIDAFHSIVDTFRIDRHASR